MNILNHEETLNVKTINKESSGHKDKQDLKIKRRRSARSRNKSPAKTHTMKEPQEATDSKLLDYDAPVIKIGADFDDVSDAGG
mmetsp:Transcript_24296/g.37515  ORF Transcript_24296/g.37515 Transcript_24296/m.37515 type:complete len:83 (-) Transcript_24296:152-400(-)